MSEMIILGAKRSYGTLENGKRYDSTKLYVQTPMKENIDQVGFATVEYAWGDNTNFDKIKNLQFPLKADITLEVVTSGKTSQIVVADVEPMKSSTNNAKA